MMAVLISCVVRCKFYTYIIISFSSEVSGNCLFSSISLVLVGNNSLVTDLRALTCIELFLNAVFKCSVL